MTSTEQLRQAIDLYRAEVAFSVPVAVLPGRGGPDTGVVAGYRGNVGRIVAHDNYTAPTGILGLGWSLAVQRIVATGSGGATQFSLIGSEGVLPLVQVGVDAGDGALIYATLDYRFWTIRRDLGRERWEVTREDGSTAVYGDTATGRGTVDWGVVWGGWTGASSELAGQSAAATAWNLAEVRDLWGNAVTYSYLQVTAPVGGPGGLPYTRATYLAAIAGAGGDTARFAYGDKAAFECPPPHADPGGLNAWQDHYETKFLETITIVSPSGAELGATTFDFTDGADNTQYVGQGSMAKRLLMAIGTTFPNASPLPTDTFAYITDPSGTDYGALASATSAEGGTVTYGYAAGGVLIDRSARDVPVNVPVRAGVTFSQPRFWFAEDYMVATWLGSDAGVQVVAYRWDGRWLPTTLATLPLAGGTYGAIAVALAKDAFCVAAGGKLAVYRFSRTAVGAWDGPAQPLTLDLTSGEAITAACGSNFAAVLGTTSGKLNRADWDGAQWVGAAVIQLPGPAGALTAALAADGNRLFAASTGIASDGGDLSLLLMERTPLGEWPSLKRSTPRPLPVITGLSAAAGSGFAVIAATGGAAGDVQLTCDAVTWPADPGTLDIARLATLTLSAGASAPAPIVRGAMVGLGGLLFRYDGAGWDRFSTNAVTYPGEQAVSALSFGFDVAVRSMVKTNQSPLFDLAAYDPGAVSPAPNWSVPQAFAGLTPTGANFTARAAQSPYRASPYVVFPVATGPTWSNGVYAQAPGGSWSSVLTLTDVLTAAELPSLQVLGESCCVYQTGTTTVVYPLRNGAVTSIGRIALANQKVLVPSGTGSELVGPSSFITYGGTWGGGDQTLTLHRMVQDAVAGKQSVAAVITATEDTGYATLPLAVQGDSTTATVSADGWQAAYNQTTNADGTTDVANAPNGTSVTYFFNGLTADEAPATPYPSGPDTNATSVLALLAGQIYQRKDRMAGPGTPPTLTDAGSATWYLWGYLQPLSGITGDNRKGFFSRPKRIARLLDGVTTAVRMTYTADDNTPPATGLPITVATDRFNASGAKETLSQAFTYFWEKYDRSRALNVLTPVVQTIVATNGTTTAITIDTWRNDWDIAAGRWAPAATYRAIQAIPATAFDWQAGTGAPASWLFGTAVTRRSVRGLPSATTDVLGRYSGAVFDSSGRLTVASFVNARLDQAEAGFFGCEPYETNPYWGYVGGDIGDHLVDAQAHTGTRSIQVDPTANTVKQGPAATFLRTTGSRRYLFSCWLLTDIGFGTTTGTARWELQVYTATATPVAVGAPIALDLPDTAAKWAYLHATVDLAAVRAANSSIPPGTPLSIGLLGYNQKSGKRCWLDELRFSPLDSLYAATVFDVDSRLPSASLGANGTTMRLVRDDRQTITATIGPDENVASLSTFTYARSLSGTDTFDAKLPNSILQIGSLANGAYYDFDPSDKADWTLPNLSWDVTDRRLTYGGTSSPDLFSQAKLTGFSRGNYALQVDVQRQPTGGAAAANVMAGTGNVYVTWDEGSATWSLFAPPASGQSSAAIATRGGRFASSWCFALIEQLVLFYADGLQVFCHQLAANVRGDGQLLLGLSAPGSFRNLVIPVEPQMSVSFLDGAGKTMQQLSLVDGNTVVAGGTLYDPLQRPLYGKNPVQNPLVITAPAVPSTAEQNRLIGDIGSYLPYQDGTQLTLAQYIAPANLYPFTQTRYETAPLGRVVERGQPGIAFAVGSGHTYRFAYGGNTANDPLTPLLPAGSAGRTPGSYYVVTTTDPNNVVDYQLINQSDQVLAKRVRTGGTDAAPVYQTAMFFYDPADRLVTIQLPNYFTPPSGSTAAPWVIQRGYSFLGQIISATTPDTGQTQYAYDSSGRVRFVMDAEDAAQSPQRFKYFIYDGLNRVVATGSVQKTGLTWAGLAAYVDQQTWPDTSVSPSVYSQSIYDSDGAGADNLEGRLWRQAINNGGATSDTDTYSYDRRGNVLTRTSAVVEYGTSAYQNAVVYNNLSLPIMTTYPRPLDQNGQPVGAPFQVTYFYDRLARLAGVGQPPAGGEVLDPEHPRSGPEIYYASYLYDPMSNLSSARLNDNALGHPVQRAISYNSAGWPTAIGGDFYAQALSYDQGGFGGAAYYDGKIASSATTYRARPGNDPWSAPPTSQRQWTYQYDALGQLQVADAGIATNAALAIGGAGGPVSYDANGNVLAVPRGPTTEQYDYRTGTDPNKVWNTNRVQTVTSAVNAAIQFADGQTYPGWSRGASNGGPSASVVVTPTGGGSLPPGQALQLAGGSPGHTEYLQFAGSLAMGGTYQLAYWIQTPDPFAAQSGPAGWYLRLFTESGQIVDALLRDLGSGSTAWVQVTDVTVDTQSIVDRMGLDSAVIGVALVLINGRMSGTSAPGASVLVADVALTGSAIASQYGYAIANGPVTSASGPHLSALSYHPFTGLTTAITVAGDQAKSVSYLYGPGTQRSAEIRTEAGATTKVLDLYGPDGRPLARRTTQNQAETIAYFLHGAEGVLATVPADAPTTTRYALNDQLGSPRVVFDQNASVLQTYDYGPFGEVIAGPADLLQPFGFTGQPFDQATGLNNYQARLYDPTLRRFYAPDPAHEGATPYAYVGNDPINAVDPTGMFIRPVLRVAWAGLRFGAAGIGAVIAHLWRNKGSYYLGSAIGQELVRQYISQEKFPDTFLGAWWESFSDLDKWKDKGRLQNLIYRILDNFSRSELVVMMEYFPGLSVLATPGAWALVYYPVQAAVDAVGRNDGQQINAIRHMTWMCSAKRYLWRGDRFANDLGEAHEHGRKGHIYDQISDRINNAIALYLTGVSSKSCQEIAFDAWNQGILARNGQYDPGRSAALDVTQMVESWRAGIEYLKKTNYAPLFNDEDWVELERHGINRPPPTLIESWKPTKSTMPVRNDRPGRAPRRN